MIHDLVEDVSINSCQEKLPSQDWDWAHIAEQVMVTFGLQLDWDDRARTGLTPDTFEEKLLAMIMGAYQDKEKELGADHMRYLERIVLLQMVDNHWKDHLLGMDHLRQGIGLRGYGQKNPLDEYKREGFEMFNAMIDTVKLQTISTLLRIQVASQSEMEEMEARQRAKQEEQLALSRIQGPDTEDKQLPNQRQGDKVGRNDPCPCGSGQKYKRCCGKQK
jgi:preprotein translocase subunit SecA